MSPLADFLDRLSTPAWLLAADGGVQANTAGRQWLSGGIDLGKLTPAPGAPPERRRVGDGEYDIVCWTAGAERVCQAVPVAVPVEPADWADSCDAAGGAQDDWLRRGLLASSADCVKILDRAGRVLYMNPGGRQIMAVDDFSKVAGAEWVSFWQGEHRHAAEAAVEQALGGSVGRFVGHCPRLNGEWRWWDVVVSPMRDAQGGIVRLLSVSRDVTEMKAAANVETLRSGIFEKMAAGEPLPKVLDQICQLAREMEGGAHAVLLSDDEGGWQVVSSPDEPGLMNSRWPGESPALPGAQMRVLAAGGVELGQFAALRGAKAPDAALALATMVLERAAHQRRLRMKQERLAIIESQSIIGLYQIDAAGHWVYTNARYRELTGLTPEQSRGEGWAAAVHPEDRAAVLAAWREARERGTVFDAEFRLNVPEGHAARWIVAHEMRTEDGGHVGTFSDITTIRRTLEELAEGQGRFRTLANNISQFCWMADAKGWIFWYNDRWYEYTGTTLADMEGWGWRQVHHPEHVDRVVEKLSRHWESGEPWEDTFPLRGKDGEYRWFLSRAIPIRDERGEIVRWFGTNTDITAERDLAEALNDRNAALERSNDDLRRIAFMASHDLKEPLRLMTTHAQMVQRSAGDRLDEKAQAHLQAIVQSGSRMGRLIQSLLSYAEVSAEPGLDRRVPVPLDPVVDGVLDHLRPLLEEHGAQVEREPLPVVLGIEAQLGQVFQNLIVNSIKYRRPEVPPRIGIRVARDAGNPGHWRITLRDNGQGFAPEHNHRVFDFLKRLHGREVEGTGIGLSICKSVVERHGGEIEAHGEPGAGAVFSFTLVAAYEEAASA